MDQRGIKRSLGRVGGRRKRRERELKKINVKFFSEEVPRTRSGKKKREGADKCMTAYPTLTVGKVSIR